MTPAEIRAGIYGDYCPVSFSEPDEPRGNYLHILSALREKPWAITEAALRTMNDIVERPVADMLAVAAKRGQPNEKNSRLEMRGSTAVLAIEGPIFRYANLMTALSGATSVQSAALAFDAAVEDPKVTQIVLHINSPGGEVDGISSFADQIRAATEKKPVTAFVDGLGASAAYWLASAASRIVADESSRVGSIGVVATVTDRRDAQERQGVKTYEFVSSQSPAKRPDPATDQGRSLLQALVDETADLFISRVAQFRGTTSEKVVTDFGGGKTLLATAALNAGMIDKISPFEAFLRSLDAPAQITQPAAPFAEEENPMETTAQPASAANNVSVPLNATGISVGTFTVSPPVDQKQRIRDILALPEAQGRSNLAHYIALDTDVSVDTAKGMLAASPAEPQATASAAPAQSSFERMMNALPKPNVGAAGSTDGIDPDSTQAEVARILEFVPKERKIA